MKTILFNTQTGKTEGRVRECTFSDIWNSALSKEPGWTPEHIIELEVIRDDPPDYNPDTQRLTSQWQADTQAGTYTMVWTLTDLTPEEIQESENRKNWPYQEWAKRIVAPIDLVLDDIGIKMYGWFQLNGFPVEKVNDTTVHLYCNTILPAHEDIVGQLGDAIFIEDSPWAES